MGTRVYPGAPLTDPRTLVGRFRLQWWGGGGLALFVVGIRILEISCHHLNLTEMNVRECFCHTRTYVAGSNTTSTLSAQ